jgi:vacuolar-type H+-ATPase subunit H
MTVSDGRQEPNAEVLLRRVTDIISNTRALPLSSSAKLDNKEEVLELLDEACERLPEELKQARWLLKERVDFLEKMQREGEDILEAARIRAERMVQRTEIVREAQHTARRTLEEAREEARRLRHEAEDYCDQKLAAFVGHPPAADGRFGSGGRRGRHPGGGRHLLRPGPFLTGRRSGRRVVSGVAGPLSRRSADDA